MNSSSPHGWAFRSFPVFCHDKQSCGAHPSPQVILHMWEETCRVSFQKWHSWIKGCAAFIFWLLLWAWSPWRVHWSRVQQQGVWGRACPGPLQGAMSTIGACVKPNKATRESLTLKVSASPTLDFCKDTFLDGEIASSHFWALSRLNQGQAWLAAGPPSVVSLSPPKPGLWNKVLRACHQLVQTGLIPSCWREKDSKWIFTLVVLNNWWPTNWRSSWGRKKQETRERQVQMPLLCPGS